MGTTREERLEAIQTMVDKMMDRYATGFGKDRIKSHKNLLYFYTIHEYREDEKKNLRPGIHVHIIVSRKDLNGQFKLSPMTNHRGETAGVIKSGFNRDAFYRDCERIFDTTHGYQRPIAESYDYHNTLKHGCDADKAAMIRAAVKEDRIFESITNALTKRAVRLAQEAATAEAKRKREDELARIDADKKKRNEFWNNYHSYYKPSLEELDKQCEEAFSLYRDLKNQGINVETEIDEQFQRLKNINGIIRQKRQEMIEAETNQDLLEAFTFMVACANPVAALILSLALLIAINAKKLENKKDIHTLRQRADEIRKGIEALKEEQEKLKFAQQDTLRQYVQVKDEKKDLTSKLQELRNELVPKKETIDLDSLAKDLAKRKEAPKETNVSHALHALGIYGQLMSAETKLDLELELLTTGTVIEPVYHPNGGVADFSIITNDEKSLASTTYSDEKLTAMLEKWGEITGQTPAHRISGKPETGKSLSTKRQVKQIPNRNKPRH